MQHGLTRLFVCRKGRLPRTSQFVAGTGAPPRPAMQDGRMFSAPAADTFMGAWVSRDWIKEMRDYPAAPSSAAEVYEVHKQIAGHELAAALGGLGGYKVGAPGVEGEVVWYAPLFRSFFVPEIEGKKTTFSISGVNAHQVEPELVVVLSEDLPAKRDLSAHSADDVWSAVGHVHLAIEVCGSRATQDVKSAQTRLAVFADSLNAGGLVLGKRLEKDSVSPADLAKMSTSLFRNAAEVARGGGGKVFPGEGTGPIDALCFVANHLNHRGLMLRKGMAVATGQTCMTRDFIVGDDIMAHFGEAGALGFVRVRLAP